MRVVLTDGEADMAAGAARKDQHRAGDGFGVAPEQQPIAGPVGVAAQRAKQRFIGQAHANAGFHEIAAPGVLARVAQTAAVALQPIHQPAAITGFIAAQRGLGFGDPRQGALRCQGGRPTIGGDQLPQRTGGSDAPAAINRAGRMAKFIQTALD